VALKGRADLPVRNTLMSGPGGPRFP
jgi:hypothetical protein